MADGEEQTTYAIVGINYPRIRYGDEKRFGEDWHDRVYAVKSHPCHDCNAFPGAFHVPGCDMEECPRCGHQSISCACDEEELPFLRAENERLREELQQRPILYSARDFGAVGDGVTDDAPAIQAAIYKAELDRLRALNAAQREIVAAVAAIQESGTGYASIDSLPYDAQISAPTIGKARALLAQEEEKA